MKLKEFIILLRPTQWIKNWIVFAPLFFSGSLYDVTLLWQACLVFVSFCLMSSGVYCLNDICDVTRDRLHPMKCNRPIALGIVSRSDAMCLMFSCIVVSLFVALLSTEWKCLIFVLFCYLLLNIAYCISLKHIAIIDVTCISVGFVLRMIAGCVSTNIMASQWLLLMTYLLALFLALTKRYDDVLIAEQTGERIRESISGYSRSFIALSLGVAASVMLVCYIMYTMSEEITARLATRYVLLTSIWVLTAVLRFLQVAFVLNRSASPTRVVMTDRIVWFCFLGWLLNFFLIIY